MDSIDNIRLKRYANKVYYFKGKILIHCIFAGLYEMAKFLLRKNAGVNIQNKYGYTALHIAT